MSTVFSTLKSNLDSNITTNQQYNSHRNQNSYSSLFNECGSLNTTSATSSHVDFDFDISDIIVKSVNIAKENRYVYRSKPITKKNLKIPAAYVIRVLMTIKKQFCVICVTSGYTGNAMEQQLRV